jgi:uncharacterized membrane protein HdeD (DUF308 family)
MSRRAGTTRRSDGRRRHRSVHTPGPKALVWITATRGVMAIVLGLALALQRGDRAPAALVNFMGVYWMLNGIVTLQWGAWRWRADAAGCRWPRVRSGS